jgi:hypothetical protein
MRLGRTAAAAAVGMAVLTGCSDGGTANETLPPVTSSAAPTTEALQPLGPADFPVPDAARQKTPEGVVAFTTYYIDLTEHLLPSLDSQPLRDFSRACEVCDQLADGYDADRAAGYRYAGDKLTIESTGTAVVKGDRGEISFLLNQPPVTVYDSLNQLVPDRQSDAYKLTGGLALQWDESAKSWLVTQLTADRL